MDTDYPYNILMDTDYPYNILHTFLYRNLE